MSDESKGGGDRLPPFSEAAERSVLGCILLDPVVVLNGLAERRLEADWFYDLRHQLIYHAARTLHDAQKPVDTISVQLWLKDGGHLDEVGGVAYLNELQDTTPSALNVGHYVEVLKEKFLLRRLLQICTHAAGRLLNGEGEAEALLLELWSSCEKLTESHQEVTEQPLKQIMKEVITDMEEQHYTRGSAQLRGLPTGPPGNYMDKMLGGLREDFYVVLAGRPGDGKTSLALNWVEYLALDYEWREVTGQKDAQGNLESVPRRGIPVGVFSLEMSDQSLGYRMLFGRAQVDMSQYNTGYASEDNTRSLTVTSGELCRGTVIIDDASGQSIGQIAAKARRWVKQYGIKLFVLDYIQLLDGDNARDDDRLRLAKISKKLVALKKQLKVPWLVLAQMNRNIETSESKRIPVLSDLKDCGALEQDADVVVFLYRPDRKSLNYVPEGRQQSDADMLQTVCGHLKHALQPVRMNASIAKHRFGPTGRVDLLFQKNLTRFEDWHMWKVRHGLEERKEGERPSVVPSPKQVEMDEPL